ncbi:DUF4240 domain-containing protein [Lacibacter sediminis]|uniref:DUF4240 domain-containing protein n=1 Tax=Lacibacter sediminis TaxID=2760713 RepID=A0A7G5XDY3_9BACT|nr:DUF4240 domain-containing protein [Lacibacter sediminis]QNA43686.1 DUF4240 domain-containing protein [Lacibacter sediminis]
MNLTLTVVTVFLFIIIVRLLFRKIWDLPKYKGRLITDGSGISDFMTEEEFWKIIPRTRDQSNRHYPSHCALLTETLSKLTSDEIIRFNRTFLLIMAQSYDYRLWEAAYSLNGGCSDDAFEYFRSWLISQGKNKFYWTLKFPRLLFLIGVKEIVEHYEGIAYCAYEAYQRKNNTDIPEVTDIAYKDGGVMFKESESFFKYPELALLAW